MDPELVQYNLSRFYEENHVFAPPKPRPLPVVVITGFLGSGKTTLLQRLLSERENLRVAAIAHDLAANVNVDAAYVAGSEKALRVADAATNDGAIVGLGGCACCDGFDKAFRGAVGMSLKQGVDEGRLDYLVVETSGAADPRRLICTLEQRFGPMTRARLDRVVAVIDAEVACASDGWLDDRTENAGDAALSGGRATRKGDKSFLDPDEVHIQRTQLACADLVLLNKIDLIKIDNCVLDEAEARIREIAPHAQVLRCSFGNVPLTELLEVTVVSAEATAAISHELTPPSWEVAQDIEPKERPASGTAENLSVGQALQLSSGHGARHRLVEWSTSEGTFVSLARLQAFLAKDLPRWQQYLRRGKGVLWMAEDPLGRVEWQVSGRLRYAVRRDASGFDGVARTSYLVLIFSNTFPDESAAQVRMALEQLVDTCSPREVSSADRAAVAAAFAAGGATDFFEFLDPPVAPSPSQTTSAVMRFRLTGRLRFGIPEDVDLREAPYSIDVDAMNLELSRLVCASQGGVFLAVGDGVERKTGRKVVALLWPVTPDSNNELPSGSLQMGSEAPAGVPPTPQYSNLSLAAAVGDAARSEAEPLLRRYFAHVQSCHCGQ